MDTTQTIVAILGALGAGSALSALTQGFIKWFSGAAHRERERNTSAIAQRAEAIKERDIADTKRRAAEEHVAILKHQLLELGIKPKERQ